MCFRICVFFPVLNKVPPFEAMGVELDVMNTCSVFNFRANASAGSSCGPPWRLHGLFQDALQAGALGRRRLDFGFSAKDRENSKRPGKKTKNKKMKAGV